LQPSKAAKSPKTDIFPKKILPPKMSVLSLKCHIGYYWDTLTDGGTLTHFFDAFFSRFFQDGSLSDTAVSSIDALDRPRHQRHEGGRGGRTAANAAANAASAGMGKKSNSTSQLSAAGNERRPPITPHHIICTQIAG
jgi:hypothetical protein